jgi:hypothetical protein
MKADDLLRDPFLPRRALATIGFLRSCVRAGELIDPQTDAAIDDTIAKLKEIAYPPRDSGDASDDVVIDEHGQPVVLPLGVVRDQVQQIAIEGEQVASIFRRGKDLGVMFSGDPDAEMADALEQAARGVRASLKRH